MATASQLVIQKTLALLAENLSLISSLIDAKI